MAASAMFEVKHIDEKGLGCFATTDIKTGTLIHSEYPQIPKDDFDDILTIWEAFKRMSRIDQLEFMTLFDKYTVMRFLPLDLKIEFKHEIEKEFRELKSYIAQHYGHDPMKIREILKVYNIYQTNHFENGVSIKASRINHSCRPNACCFLGLKNTNSPIEIRAVADIKEGEEITISYVNEYDYGLQDRKSRQEVLLRGRFFLCQCEYCENGPRYNDKTLQGLMNDAIKYHNAFIDGHTNKQPNYQFEMCRKEIECYKKICYHLMTDRNVPPIILYQLTRKAHDRAIFGHKLYKTSDLKIDAKRFASTNKIIGQKFGVKFVE